MLRRSYHLSHLITFYNSLQLDRRAYSFLQQLLSILIVVRSFINREQLIHYRYCWHLRQICLYSVAFPVSTAFRSPFSSSNYLIRPLFLFLPTKSSMPFDYTAISSTIFQRQSVITFSTFLAGWLVAAVITPRQSTVSLGRSIRVGSLLCPQGVSLFTAGQTMMVCILLYWIHTCTWQHAPSREATNRNAEVFCIISHVDS